MKAKLGTLVLAAVIAVAGVCGFRVIKQRIAAAMGIQRVKAELAKCMSSKKFQSDTIPREDYRYLLLVAVRGDEGDRQPRGPATGRLVIDQRSARAELPSKLESYALAASIQVSLADGVEEQFEACYLWFSAADRDRFIAWLRAKEDSIPEATAAALRGMAQLESDPERKRQLQALLEKAEGSKQEAAPPQPGPESALGGASELATSMPATGGPAYRTWTDREGRTFNGRLLSQDPIKATVTVESQSGKLYTTPTSVFSDQDQQYLRSQLRRAPSR